MDSTDEVTGIARDPDALEAFYRHHLEDVRRFVARRVSDPHDAADLTADIFLAAIEAAPRYRASAGRPAAWLIGIARHVVADHYRRTARDQRATQRMQSRQGVPGRELLAEDAIERIAGRIDAERAGRELYRSLADLPPGQRAVLELVAVDGLSLTEAAGVLGISAVSARVRYHRGRQSLIRILPRMNEVIS